MKISRSQLKKLIKEVTENMHGEEEQPAEEGPDAGALAAGAGGEQKSDVKVALQYIQKVDNRSEFAQMAQAVIQHGAQIQGGKAILNNIRTKLIPKVMGMMEGKLNEDDVQLQPGGNWGQPLPGEEEAGMRDVESLAMDIADLLQGVEHNDAVDALTLAAETLGLTQPEEEPKRPIGFVREALRKKLIEEGFKRALANALKK